MTDARFPAGARRLPLRHAVRFYGWPVRRRGWPIATAQLPEGHRMPRSRRPSRLPARARSFIGQPIRPLPVHSRGVIVDF